MKIDAQAHQYKVNLVTAMQQERQEWWQHWRLLADYILPKRYNWLLSPTERRQRMTKNPNILDDTGTKAARTLASGMMNGITSPSRPWFKLRIAGFQDDLSYSGRVWLDEVERRLMLIFAESNFYNCLAIMYMDLVVFGTSSMLIYDDDESVIRCYNCPLGEYYLGQDYHQRINIFAREFTLRVRQVVEQFGLENCSERVRSLHEMKNQSEVEVKIVHLIEPNIDKSGVSKEMKFREYYWESGGIPGEILSEKGYYEMPGVFPRWEVTGNDSYGTSVAMDALGNIIQLQHEVKRKAQSLDYMNMPPKVASIQLKGQPTAFLPGKTTFVTNLNEAGVKPIFQFVPPIQEMMLDIRDVKADIRETMHNDLFKMISQLETVRSATEIDARREEKLVLLGPVLERFHNEGLDPALTRTFEIANRAGLIPPPPEEIAGMTIEIQYVSILSAAQSAVGVIPTERFLGLIGNVAAMVPTALNIPNFDEILRDYGRDIGVKAKHMNTKEQSDMMAKQQAEQQAAQEMAAVGPALAQGAKNLSETDVGGGANALQQMLGG